MKVESFVELSIVFWPRSFGFSGRSYSSTWYCEVACSNFYAHCNWMELGLGDRKFLLLEKKLIIICWVITLSALQHTIQNQLTSSMWIDD